ncbi:MAG: capsule biosynthesis protein [Gammaproteobacteria bacterium]|nr:capsule biosynthesis protein [Gammaproteobacteria bacterium]
MRKLFLTHPHHAGETYLVHFKFAVWAGLQMFLAGLICIIHAVFPFVFEHAASNIIIPLADKLSGRVEAISESKKRKKNARSKK